MKAHVAEWKKEDVNLLTNLIKEYNTIGLLDITSMPSYQLQKMRAQLKDSAIIVMTRLKLIKRALQQAKEKNNVVELEKHISGIPALIFSKKDSFRLSKILIKNKSSAKAKPGQIAPSDIAIPAGPTPFTPGPVIGELGQLGIKTVIEGGKINVKENTVIVKKGQVISERVSAMLSKLGIEPMEIGLNLVASYEDGNIYTKDVLNVNELDYINKIKNAYKESLNLALNASIPIEDTILLLIKKAYLDTLALSNKLKINILKDIPKVKEEKLVEVKKDSIEVKPISDKEFQEHEKVAKKILSNLQSEKAKHLELPKHKEEKFKKIDTDKIIGG